ncbi:MAG: ribosomal L7Ae/L30e/S12e/Gadd45 family protein [Firmicutes bacterium]|nr:ribosomal L7Ae/L30e/S12e/Gadd45 family protein [Bacillota bacterium]
MKDKLESYLGFARRSRNIIFGAGTCELMMNKGRVKYLIIAEDTAENTKKKLVSQAERMRVPYAVYGLSDELSRMTGNPGRSVFGITDEHFADIIRKQIEP